MKICTKCGNKWQEEFNICPICGSKLEFEQEHGGMISMGNANAVSGGIHHSDDHSVKNDCSVSSSNNTSNSHNTTTTNNSTTQNIYNGSVMQVEREKSQEELLKERKLKYRECCKKVLLDGLLTGEERTWLEEQRILLDLPAEMASHILHEVSNNHQRAVMSMGTVQRIQFNNLKRAVEGNMSQNIRRLLPQIKVIATKFQEEELQYYYHMVLAALNPQECIEAYTKRTEDKYWLTFWTYVALHKLGDVANAENTMIDLGKWQGLMPDENLVILGALGSLIEGDKEIASELYMQAVTGEYSSLLSNLTEVLVSIMNYDPDNADILSSIAKNRFYVENFLQVQYKNEVERFQRIAEEERKKKLEEDQKRKEEEERERKAEEERKKRFEEERKKQEEEAHKEAEERRRKFEADKKKEEERKKKLEEDQKRKEEEERERKAEEERKKRFEEERKKQEEEARKEAEERRRKFEVSQNKIDTGSRPRYCRMCGTPLRPEAIFCNVCGTRVVVAKL